MAINEEFYLRDVAFDSDYVQAENEGDLSDIVGVENVRQALMRRFVTIKGSLIHRPDYGASLKLYQNAPTSLAKQRELALQLEEQALRDPRVESVLGVSINVNDREPEKTTIIARVKLVGYGETALSFQPFGEF
jgi:phage baseplate assembly protein W